jgi:hypothetical protein
MRKKMLVIAPLAIVGMAVFIAVGGELVRLLWNALLPALFGWPRVTFWQALGLLALCRILFGGFGVAGRCGAGGRARARVRERMAERWQRMTPEERERFRRSWRGHWAPPATSERDPTGGVGTWDEGDDR